MKKKKELGVDSMREESWVGEMGEGSQGYKFSDIWYINSGVVTYCMVTRINKIMLYVLKLLQQI